MGRVLGTLSTVAGLAALGFTVWWLKTSGPPPVPEDPPRMFTLPVTTSALERGVVEPRVRLTGTVRAPTRSALAFETEGVLAVLVVREVDRVKEGDVLARLRSRNQELQVASEEKDLELARRELALLEAGEREEQKKRLAALRDGRLAEEMLAASDVERGEKLLVDDVISEVDLERRKAVHAGAEARTEAAEQELAEAVAGTRPEDIAIAEAKVDVALAALEVAQAELAKTELAAPTDGVILARLASVGDYVSAGTAVVEMVDLSDIEIDVEIPARVASRLGPEPGVRMTSDGLEGFEIESIIDAVIPVADERSRNFRGLIRLAATDADVGRLRPGMFVRLDVALLPVADAFVVPADAVRTTADGQMIVRSNPGPASPHGPTGVAEIVPVRILGVDGNRVAVGSLGVELAEGDSIVVTGVDRAFVDAVLLPSPHGGDGSGE